MDIYSKITADSYKIGITNGKSIALNAITNSLSTVVFSNPQKQTNQEY
jgi:hypothetical protein